MLGLIVAAGLGAFGYGLHQKKKSNSYIVAKCLEHAIDNKQKVEIEGWFDSNEVYRVMIEDGYDPFGSSVELCDDDYLKKECNKELKRRIRELDKLTAQE